MNQSRNSTGPKRYARLLLAGSVAALTAGTPGTTPLAPQSVHAQRAISVFINDQPLNFGSAAPARFGNSVFVPMRAIFEGLGAEVGWDNATKTITAQRGTTVVQMQINNRSATINGQPVTLSQPPLLYNNATMVPLRFVGEALGAEVRWSETQSAVFITKPADATPLPAPGTNPVTPTVPTTPGTNPVTPTVPTTPVTPTVPTTPVTPTVPTTPVTPTVPQVNTLNGTLVKVDPAPPATITIQTKDQAGATRIESYTMAPDVRPLRNATAYPTQPGATPIWGQPQRISFTGLTPGDDVQIQLGAGNTVTALNVYTLLAPGRIRSIQNRTITLDDARGTQITISDNTRFSNAAGKWMTSPDARPGDSVALWVAPSTNTIYAVSARDSDIRLAGGTPNVPVTPGTPGTPTYVPPTTPVTPGTNPGTTPIIPGTAPGTNPTTPGTTPPGTAFLQSVTHSATKPLKAGDTVQITVRANTTGLRGAFTIAPRMAAVPLQERADRPGLYVANYTVKPGDDVLNGRVTVTMTGANNVQDTQQSQPITIDTVPPRINGVFPSTGSQINNNQPNLAVYADDVGGSGLARGTIQLTPATGQPINVPAVVVVGGLSGETPRALPPGQVNLRATVADAAGNEAQTISIFTVMGAAPGGVNAITPNARTALKANDVLVVELNAEPNGRAAFDLVGDNNRTVGVNLPMREIAAGRYQGTYVVRGNEGTNRLRVVGRFTGVNNQTVTNEATTMVNLAAPVAAQTNITITAPANQTAVTSPLTIRGRALPGAVVDVSIRAEGTKVTRLLLLENRRPYTQELGTQQMQADANGNWSTRAIELPTPKDVEDLKFVITATQTDSLNRRSEPVTVTVTPR